MIRQILTTITLVSVICTAGAASIEDLFWKFLPHNTIVSTTGSIPVRTHNEHEPREVRTLLGKDGSIYTGETKGGIANGQGRTYHPDGRTFEGEHINGYSKGYGVATYPNGNTITKSEKSRFFGDSQTGTGVILTINYDGVNPRVEVHEIENAKLGRQLLEQELPTKDEAPEWQSFREAMYENFEQMNEEFRKKPNPSTGKAMYINPQQLTIAFIKMLGMVNAQRRASSSSISTGSGSTPPATYLRESRMQISLNELFPLSPGLSTDDSPLLPLPDLYQQWTDEKYRRTMSWRIPHPPRQNQYQRSDPHRKLSNFKDQCKSEKHELRPAVHRYAAIQLQTAAGTTLSGQGSELMRLMAPLITETNPNPAGQTATPTNSVSPPPRLKPHPPRPRSITPRPTGADTEEHQRPSRDYSPLPLDTTLWGNLHLRKPQRSGLSQPTIKPYTTFGPPHMGDPTQVIVCNQKNPGPLPYFKQATGNNSTSHSSNDSIDKTSLRAIPNCENTEKGISDNIEAEENTLNSAQGYTSNPYFPSSNHANLALIENIWGGDRPNQGDNLHSCIASDPFKTPLGADITTWEKIWNILYRPGGSDN
ncbi:MAG: hypothetical protein LBF56_01685 [Holosporales bacterium]|jgi:hypothetical protein|nr:hypothetical protein [Holosporales bacterium]